MQRSAIFLGQPITGIEGQELDLGSFGQIGRLVNDKPPSLHASLQRHATTVASGPPRNKVLELARGRGARQSRPGRYPSGRNRDQVSRFGSEGSVRILSPRPITSTKAPCKWPFCRTAIPASHLPVSREPVSPHDRLQARRRALSSSRVSRRAALVLRRTATRQPHLVRLRPLGPIRFT
jgi:hypothetical protein